MLASFKGSHWSFGLKGQGASQELFYLPRRCLTVEGLDRQTAIMIAVFPHKTDACQLQLDPVDGV